MTTPRPVAQHTTLELGDLVTKGLTTVGITDDRVSALLGRPCSCPFYREQLNKVSRWARRMLRGETSNAQKELDDIFDG